MSASKRRQSITAAEAMAKLQSDHSDDETWDYWVFGEPIATCI